MLTIFLNFFYLGRMQGNPYSSTEPGLGPLMRDIKNKICQDVRNNCTPITVNVY